MVVQMTPYGHQAYACMHAVLRHNELIVPRASYLAQCKRSTMLKFMLCCQGDPNCPRFPAPGCNQTLCASVVLTSASLDSHRHHLGSSTGPRSFSPSATSLLHYPHPLPSPPATWCQDSSSAAPCTPCSRLSGRLSR